MKLFNTVSVVCVAACMTLLNAPAHASNREDYEVRKLRRCLQADEQVTHIVKFLNEIDERFQGAKTDEEKRALVSSVVDCDKVKEVLDDYKNMDLSALGADVGPDPVSFGAKCNFNKTTPLCLAVSMGKWWFVRDWLAVVDNVNDTRFTQWGYRQPYTLAHIAMDPEDPVYNRSVSLADRLQIIDLLGTKGANFNAIISHSCFGIYDNPPLDAGDSRGWGAGQTIGLVPLRVRALLYGADPAVRGSSFYGIERRLEDASFVSELLNQAVEVKAKGVEIRPVESVRQVLIKAQAERIALLQSMQF